MWLVVKHKAGWMERTRAALEAVDAWAKSAAMGLRVAWPEKPRRACDADDIDRILFYDGSKRWQLVHVTKRVFVLVERPDGLCAFHRPFRAHAPDVELEDLP